MTYVDELGAEVSFALLFLCRLQMDIMPLLFLLAQESKQLPTNCQKLKSRLDTVLPL